MSKSMLTTPTNYVSVSNGLQVGAGYDVEVLRMADDGDLVLIFWRHLPTQGRGMTEATLAGRSLEEIAVEAGAGALADWEVQWEEDDEDAYLALASRWDARIAVIRARRALKAGGPA